MYRRLLTRAVESMENIKMVGTAPTGSIALQKVSSAQPDVVLLDIEMPDMNGIQVLENLKAQFPAVEVVLISGVNSRSADVVMDGLSKGAVDFIPKPEGDSLEDNIQELTQRLRDVFRAVQTLHFTRKARGETPAVPAVPPPSLHLPPAGAVPSRMTTIVPVKFSLVAVGVSTGGPKALEEFIPRLPQGLPVPVVVVQHMPPVFTASLARQLEKKSKLRVVEGADRMAVEPGTVYIAPGGIHTLVEADSSGNMHLRMNDGPPVNSCKPAVDVMFRSVAEFAGGRTLAIIMTGMGKDGLYGVELIKGKGGYCLTQSPETCVVYGMPQAVDQARLSDESVPLELLAQRVKTLLNLS